MDVGPLCSACSRVEGNGEVYADWAGCLASPALAFPLASPLASCPPDLGHISFQAGCDDGHHILIDKRQGNDGQRIRKGVPVGGCEQLWLNVSGCHAQKALREQDKGRR